jgi:hypothetical protein
MTVTHRRAKRAAAGVTPAFKPMPALSASKIVKNRGALRLEMGESVDLLQWNSQRKQICETISSRRAKVKVVLKTRNENQLLSDWINYHTKIFGYDGLVIFDHMSDCPETLKIYSSLSDEVCIFQYSGQLDRLHNVPSFPELYESLRASCDYYTFIDTDEFLCWLQPDKSIFKDKEIVNRILDSGEKVIPGIWANNLPGERDKFKITFKKNSFVTCVRGGKPMINSDFPVDGFINHNFQLDPICFSDCLTGGLFVQHIKNISVARRISVNLQKIRNFNLATKKLEPFGLFGDDFSLLDVIGIDSRLLPEGGTRTYLTELQSLYSSPPSVSNRGESVGFVNFEGDFAIFSDPFDERDVLGFISDPVPVLRACFQNSSV